VETALNATPGSFTFTYTNQDGTTSQTTPSLALTASAAVGTASPIRLNGTDWGVRDITAASRTSGTSPTGVIRFYGVYPIAMLDFQTGSTMGIVKNLLNNNLEFYKLAAGDTLGFFVTGSSVGAILGSINFIGMAN
jgi:hypothetical protein